MCFNFGWLSPIQMSHLIKKTLLWDSLKKSVSMGELVVRKHPDVIREFCALATVAQEQFKWLPFPIPHSEEVCRQYLRVPPTLTHCINTFYFNILIFHSFFTITQMWNNDIACKHHLMSIQYDNSYFCMFFFFSGQARFCCEASTYTDQMPNNDSKKQTQV